MKRCVVVGCGQRGINSYIKPIAVGHLSDVARVVGIYDIVRARAALCSEEYGSIPAPQLSGILDIATEESLSAFQYLSGLPETGSLDKVTWKHLALQYPLAVNKGQTSRRIKR
jgi:hypothetical protein